MDFTLVKEGQKEPIADSGHSDFYLRSVHLEAELEEGNYIVYVGKSFRSFLVRPFLVRLFVWETKLEEKEFVKMIFFLFSFLVRFVWIERWIVMK